MGVHTPSIPAGLTWPGISWPLLAWTRDTREVLAPAPSATWITANARQTRHLRRQSDLQRQALGERAWESSDILPYDSWVVRCWKECAFQDPLATPLLLSPTQEQVLWEQAITAADFHVQDFPLLDVPSTASVALRAWELVHSSELHPDVSNCQGLPDAEAFLQWMLYVERALHRNGWITRAQLPRALAERLAAGRLPVAGPVYARGFEEYTPAQRRCFDALRQTGCAVMEEQIPAAADPQRGTAGFQNLAEEMQQATAWARRKLEHAPGARIGIAVHGLNAIADMTERIFDDVLQPGSEFARPRTRRAFHMAARGRASDAPILQTAFLALRLVRVLPLAEVGMLLRSPFVPLDDTKAAALDANLRRQGSEEVSLQTPNVRDVFPALAASARSLPAQQHPSQWSAAFSQLLAAAGWPGERSLSAEEASTVEQWKELLSDLADLDLVLPRISYDEALVRLRRIARRPWKRNEDEAPIEIMDLHEAQGLRFDALWIAGLDGGTWPASPRPNPFLPVALQRAAATPHSSPELELAHAHRLLKELLAAAPEVVCSYPLTAGAETLRPSPLIAGLPDGSPWFPPITATLQATALEELPATPPVALPEGTQQDGGSGVLEHQAACPFQAFAIHRLGAKEFEEPALGISVQEKGNVAHQALEFLWGQLHSQDELNALAPDEAAALIAQSVRLALESKLSRRPTNAVMQGLRELEQVRLEGVLADWLAEEKQRRPFCVVEREAKHKVLAGGLELKIKADRIDQYDDGSCAIVDYKTANTLSTTMWDGERPDAPQLPLYAVKSGRVVSEVFFAKLVRGDVKQIGYDGVELTQRLGDWERVIDRLGREFREGAAEADPKQPETTCKKCGLASLCRVGELRTAVPENGDGDNGENHE